MAFALSLRAQVRAQDRVLTASEPNATLFGVLLCLPTAPALPLERDRTETSVGRRFTGSSRTSHGLPLSLYMGSGI
jgi:hypothetical protein